MEKEIKTEPDLGIIYKSIGEAFLNLRYVDLSFIVLPNLKKFCPDHSHPIFLTLLLKKSLPLGVVEYPFSTSAGPGPKVSQTDLRIEEFEESYKAESSLMWKDYNTYIGYAENNFVWEKGGAVATIRDRLIQIIKKENVSLK